MKKTQNFIVAPLFMDTCMDVFGDWINQNIFN